MKKNGFEKYSEWIDIVKKKCNPENLVDTKRHMNHYILDNGLHVYTNEFRTIVTDMNVTDFFNSNYTSIGANNTPDGPNVFFRLPGHSYIEYRPEGTLHDYSGVFPSHHKVLPARDIMSLGKTKYERNLPEQGELSPDIRGLLEDASSVKHINSSGKAMYERALEFYDKFAEMIKDEIITEQDQNEQDLDVLSNEELEQLLNTTTAQNKEKEEEIYRLQRKSELIRLIKEAQKEGKQLDGRIKHLQELIAENDISK